MASTLIARPILGNSIGSDYCCGPGNRYEGNLYSAYNDYTRKSNCDHGYNLEAAMKWNGIWRSSYSGDLSYSSTKTEINNSRPVAVEIDWDNAGRHAMLIYGYAQYDNNNDFYSNYLYVYDPNEFSGGGVKIIPKGMLERYQRGNRIGSWDGGQKSKRP